MNQIIAIRRAALLLLALLLTACAVPPPPVAQPADLPPLPKARLLLRQRPT